MLIFGFVCNLYSYIFKIFNNDKYLFFGKWYRKNLYLYGIIWLYEICVFVLKLLIVIEVNLNVYYYYFLN